MATGEVEGVMFGVIVVDAPVGALFKGAPTGISQRCPGSPWAGFNGPLAVAGSCVIVVVGCGVLTAGTAGGEVVSTAASVEVLSASLPSSAQEKRRMLAEMISPRFRMQR